MKLKKILWITGGLIAFALGTAGTVLPIVPTVPLYLLAAFFFINSSNSMYDWFVRTKLYKKHLLPYLQAGGLTAKAKKALIIFVTLQIIIAALIVKDSIVGMIVLAVLYTGFLLSMVFAVKTISLEDNPVAAGNTPEVYTGIQ